MCRSTDPASERSRDEREVASATPASCLTFGEVLGGLGLLPLPDDLAISASILLSEARWVVRSGVCKSIISESLHLTNQLNLPWSVAHPLRLPSRFPVLQYLNHIRKFPQFGRDVRGHCRGAA